MQIIPFKELAAWSAQITLSDVIYILNFKWNALNKYWVMGIYGSNSNPIALGIKIVTNYDLTSQFAGITGMPLGDIVCQNVRNMFDEIKRFDMGETNELFYYEPNEIKAIEA